LMLQANPALTPNLVKAILQFTAESHDGDNALTQGAGFLNTRGAVELARSLAGGSQSIGPAGGTGGNQPGGPALDQEPDTTPWSRHAIWGNHRISGGQFTVGASAWRTDVMWGSPQTPDGAAIVLGTVAGDREGDGNIVWGTACGPGAADPSNPLGSGCDNIVWGTECGGRNCENIVWGAAGGPGDTGPS